MERKLGIKIPSVVSLMLFLFVLLLVLKLAGAVDLSWGLVFLPLWLPLVALAGVLIGLVFVVGSVVLAAFLFAMYQEAQKYQDEKRLALRALKALKR